MAIEARITFITRAQYYNWLPAPRPIIYVRQRFTCGLLVFHHTFSGSYLWLVVGGGLAKYTIIREEGHCGRGECVILCELFTIRDDTPT